MKILLIGEDLKGTCADYHKANLRDMGHQVVHYDYRQSFMPFDSRTLITRAVRHYLTGQYSSVMHRHLLATVKKHKPDLVYVIKGELLLPRTIREMKAYAKVICWFVDPIASFDMDVLKSAMEYDKFFAKDPAVVNAMRLAGHDAVEYLPEGYDALTYRPVMEEERFASDISLVGFQYAYRLYALSKLTEYDLKVWGKVVAGYPKKLAPYIENRFLSVREKNKVFNSTKININLHHPGEVDSINIRTFEICGAGGFQLVDYKPSLEEFFKPGKEVAVYKSLDELKEKIDYYLKHDKEREKIAKAGHKKAEKHTIQHRLEKMLSSV